MLEKYAKTRLFCSLLNEIQGIEDLHTQVVITTENVVIHVVVLQKTARDHCSKVRAARVARLTLSLPFSSSMPKLPKALTKTTTTPTTTTTTPRKTTAFENINVCISDYSTINPSCLNSTNKI